ncbi:MAG: Gfo/Idh/MocA family oxidoreductase [Candidatus Brocadiia bacterium]
MNPKNRDRLKVGVIGVGWHSRTSHLPALSRCASEGPDGVELTALCDLDLQKARRCADEFGFRRAYGSADQMLDTESLDACVAITPMDFTTECALDLIERGIPALIEKPPGRTLEEARSIARAAGQSGVPVMVSVNRRFEPGMQDALDWLEERPLTYLRAVTARGNRTEPRFLTETGIHSVDAVRALGGEVAAWDHRRTTAAGAAWFDLRFEFESAALGALQVLPTAGHTVERYEVFGDNWHGLVESGTHGSAAFTAWEDGERVIHAHPPADSPRFVLDGTYSETRSFLEALLCGDVPHPTPDEVLASVEICHRCLG